MDDGWKAVEIKPEAIAVNGNGHHDAIGLTVELVLGTGHVPANDKGANGNGHAAVSVNGIGHHEDAEVSQQTLFS